jgi:hypothetical protein
MPEQDDPCDDWSGQDIPTTNKDKKDKEPKK